MTTLRYIQTAPLLYQSEFPITAQAPDRTKQVQ